MGIFSKWKPDRKLKPIAPVDLSLIGVDMHSHLLPGIDDGATDLEDSMQIILHLKELGYHRFITTPHIFWDMYRNTPDIIREKLAIVKEELIRRQIPVEIEAAAEYYCDEHFEKEIEAQTLTHIRKKKVCLV
jgi:protein-tyrosine phosphatase